MMVHTFDPSTREVEAGRSVFVRSQPGLSSMFQDEKLLSWKERSWRCKMQESVSWDQFGRSPYRTTEGVWTLAAQMEVFGGFGT